MSTIKVNNITDEVGTGGPTFPQGFSVTGTLSATTLSGTLASSNLTGALPALDGSSLTGLSIEVARSNATAGYVKFSNGIIIQWDYWTYLHGTRSFPITFPNACLGFSYTQDCGWYENWNGYKVSTSQYYTRNVYKGTNASRAYHQSMMAIGY